MDRVLREGAFKGETHIVTGAAQGIGLRVAHALALHGARVAMVDLDPGRLAAAREQIGAEAAEEPLVVPCNVTDESDVQRAVAQAREAGGQIHGVVNVAGVTRDARIPKKSYADFQFVMAVHVHGTFLFMREVAAQDWHVRFKDGGNAPLRDGANRFIVNFSSVSARNGNVGQIDYTAAKGAIEAMTRTTAREFSAYGARVNAIAPGPIDTPMLAAVGEQGMKLMAAATLTGRIGTPDEMAGVVCALADPKLFGYATGQVFQVNGGLYLA
jgi:3-oxoacyl-[acyl-carrier protein] reductase